MLPTWSLKPPSFKSARKLTTINDKTGEEDTPDYLSPDLSMHSQRGRGAGTATCTAAAYYSIKRQAVANLGSSCPEALQCCCSKVSNHTGFFLPETWARTKLFPRASLPFLASEEKKSGGGFGGGYSQTARGGFIFSHGGGGATWETAVRKKFFSSPLCRGKVSACLCRHATTFFCFFVNNLKCFVNHPTGF